MEFVIVGTGGLAKEVYGCLMSMNHSVAGFVAKGKYEVGRFCGRPILGTDEWLLEQPDQNAIIANGTPWVRRQISEYYTEAIHNDRLRFPTVIHPNSSFLDYVSTLTGAPEISRVGTVVMPGSVFMPEVRVGAYTHLNMGLTIGHDTTIGNYCVINHGANISGYTTIEDDVLIGAGAVIIERHTIGRGAIVGAGAVVTKDIPPHEVWVGNPARKLRTNDV